MVATLWLVFLRVETLQMRRFRCRWRSNYTLDRSLSTLNCWPFYGYFAWQRNRLVIHRIKHDSLIIYCRVVKNWAKWRRLLSICADAWLQSDNKTNLMHEECGIETEVEDKSWTFLKTRCQLLLQLYPTTKEVCSFFQYKYQSSKLVTSTNWWMTRSICFRRIWNYWKRIWVRIGGCVFSSDWPRNASCSRLSSLPLRRSKFKMYYTVTYSMLSL